MVVSRAGNSDTFAVSTPSDVEVALTRLFDAPRALVFEAMTTPEHIRRWWGCLGEGYSVPVCEVDLRVGGKWRYGEYREIAPPDRLVFTEIFAPFPDAESVVTTVFTEEQGKTRITVTARYPSVEVRDMVLQSGMARGAAISYDRLEDVVRALAG